MTPHSDHAHSGYYHDEGLTSRHAHQRSYEQNQFQMRMTARGLPQSTDLGSAGTGVNAGNVDTGENSGGMFYPPSTFAPARMAAQQYSAAPPPPSPVTTSSAYEAQAEYLGSEMPPPSSASTNASAYYSATPDHAPAPAQYSATPISALPSTHYHQDPAPPSASSDIGRHTSSAAPSSHSATPTRGPVDPPSPTNLAARRHTTSGIGKWKMFAIGPFQGRTVHAEIREVQKADLGRKCADPPTSSNSAPRNSPANAAPAAKIPGDGDGALPGTRRGKEKEPANKNSPGAAKEKEGETKAVRKDRRPLDPPPVVELKLYESIHHGTPHQYERIIPAEDVEIGGLICQVDLYRVTIPPSPTEVASLTLAAHQSGGLSAVHSSSGSAAATGHCQSSGITFGHGVATSPVHPNYPAQPPYDQHSFAYPPARRQNLLGTDDENANSQSPLDVGWESSASSISPVSPYTYHPHLAPHHATHPHALARPNSQHPMLNTHVPTLHTVSSPSVGAPIDPDALPPPSEADKLTRVLFGESYAHACSILDLSGKPTIYFVFADLSVKLEGLFRPRYRFFDLFSRTEGSNDVPILAQCFGGAFAVYSTKEFPGLKASTPLTKHLSRWGIRVNIRETERKRRAPDGNGRNSSASTAKGKRKGAKGVGRGGSIGTGVSSGTSVRGEGESEDRQEGIDSASARTGGSGDSPMNIPHGVDAPKRYLEGTARGRGGRSRTSTVASASTSDSKGKGRRAD